MDAVFLGPDSYIGSGGGGQAFTVPVGAADQFRASFVVPPTYTTGEQNGPVHAASTTAGTGYSFSAYPAAICTVGFAVLPATRG